MPAARGPPVEPVRRRCPMQLEVPQRFSPVSHAMARLARVDVRLTLARVDLAGADPGVVAQLARALDAGGVIACAARAETVLLLYVGPRCVTEGDDAVTADLATRTEAAVAGLAPAPGPTVAPRFAATHFWSAEVGDLEAALTRLGAEPAFRLRGRAAPPRLAPAPLHAVAS